MSVIPLTLFFSLLLAGTFVLLFAREQRRRRYGSAERDSLLPLADEIPHEVEIARKPRSPHAEEHKHEHANGAGCGCRSGARPPCDGCLRRRDAQDPAYF